MCTIDSGLIAAEKNTRSYESFPSILRSIPPKKKPTEGQVARPKEVLQTKAPAVCPEIGRDRMGPGIPKVFPQKKDPLMAWPTALVI